MDAHKHDECACDQYTLCSMCGGDRVQEYDDERGNIYTAKCAGCDGLGMVKMECGECQACMCSGLKCHSDHYYSCSFYMTEVL